MENTEKRRKAITLRLLPHSIRFQERVQMVELETGPSEDMVCSTFSPDLPGIGG